jgi:hypothetical protein
MIVSKELEAIEPLWKAGLEAAYSAYLPATIGLGEPQAARVALAAALVEIALDLQRLGGEAPPPPDLLRGDLCLARASRLLADTRDRRLQIAFARAIEDQSAAAAAGREAQPTRPRLLRAIGEAGSAAV